MKKFICLFIFIFLSSGLFARNFYLINAQQYNDSTERVYLTKTQEVSGAQYSIIVTDNNWNVSWIVSLHSHENNDNMEKFAEKIFKDYKRYMEEFSKLGLEKIGRFTNNTLIINNQKYQFENSRVRIVTFFE